jgi:nucleoside 2-deoxyribosyltransferase
MDYNKNISNNILNKLRHCMDDCDVVLKDLNNFKDIKG